MSYWVAMAGQTRGSLGDAAAPPADQAPKSHFWAWMFAGAAAVGSVAYLATRSGGSRSNPVVSKPLPADWPPEYVSLVRDEAVEFFALQRRPWRVWDIDLEESLERISAEIAKDIRRNGEDDEWGDWLTRWENGETDQEIREAIEAYRDDLGNALKSRENPANQQQRADAAARWQR